MFFIHVLQIYIRIHMRPDPHFDSGGLRFIFAIQRNHQDYNYSLPPLRSQLLLAWVGCKFMYLLHMHKY